MKTAKRFTCKPEKKTSEVELFFAIGCEAVLIIIVVVLLSGCSTTSQHVSQAVPSLTPSLAVAQPQSFSQSPVYPQRVARDGQRFVYARQADGSMKVLPLYTGTGSTASIMPSPANAARPRQQVKIVWPDKLHHAQGSVPKELMPSTTAP